MPILLGIVFLSLLAQGWFFSRQQSGQDSHPESELDDESWVKSRQMMVSEQIESRGINDQLVLQAMAKVPRHYFVPSKHACLAYHDHALAIDCGQTISQPYIVAYMSAIAKIQPTDRVLEIGTGSGYQTAILAELAKEVYTVEIVPQLATLARDTLEHLGYSNIRYKLGDGYQGWREHAPYQVILVTAAPEKIPFALVEQLALNGRMIIPVGREHQAIVVITKTSDGIMKEETIPVRFVPMVSQSELKIEN